MFSKIDVNGPNAHPIYQWLKSQKKGHGLLSSKIKWNFTKFLLDREGNVIGRYGSMVTPEKLDPIIAQAL
jgi:glutathione peroxidase